uniref:RxLR effector candidate protein n=1 Tax=Hyaloperonospora arabidopsidis (strain Emoy2) TaxID=559515 RepID=A0A090BGY5_HYAAE|nr:RxLR effector candidate protein [Hyaloperonospora arabidopsidis Emoy2]
MSARTLRARWISSWRASLICLRSARANASSIAHLSRSLDAYCRLVRNFFSCFSRFLRYFSSTRTAFALPWLSFPSSLLPEASLVISSSAIEPIGSTVSDLRSLSVTSVTPFCPFDGASMLIVSMPICA